MRSTRKRIYALAITLTFLFASSISGLNNNALANAAFDPHPNPAAVKKKGKNKKASRRAGKGGSRTRAGSGRGKRRGRYARSKRGRQSVAQDYPTSGRPASTGIPTERVTEIQRALIKLGFLSGSASGQYDDDTVEAMKQFQSANQLPATGLPSAHALKRLGVSKRSSDGYAIPVKSGGQSDTL